MLKMLGWFFKALFATVAVLLILVIVAGTITKVPENEAASTSSDGDEERSAWRTDVHEKKPAGAAKPKTVAKVTAADLYVGNTVKTLQTSPGCTSPEVFDRARELAIDTEAFKKYLLQRAMIGDCKIVDKNTQVTIEESAFWSDRYRVREKGETVSYWLPSSALRDKR